ncbi:hypothetical protein BaRGS_00018442, partial [Batillaria attramentaria]
NRALWKVVGRLLEYDHLTNDQRKWAAAEICRLQCALDFEKFLFYCPNGQLDFIMKETVKHQSWGYVLALLKRKHVDQVLKRWAIMEACRQGTENEFLEMLPHVFVDQLDVILEEVLRRDMWKVVSRVLQHDHMENMQLRRLAVVEAAERAASEDVLRITTHCTHDQLDLLVKMSVERKMWNVVAALLKRQDVSEELRTSVLEDICETAPPNVVLTILTSGDADETNASLVNILNQGRRREPKLLRLCFVVPLLVAQEVNLTVRDKAMEEMTDVWEDVRRSFFMSAVENREWEVVKQLANHSLYDDQRGWALGEAFSDKQWDVLMVLADHGLTDDQLRKVHRQVAKHADWHTVLQLFERGADLQCVREDLETANPCRDRLPTPDEMEWYRRKFQDSPKMEKMYTERWERLRQFEAKYRERCSQLVKLEEVYAQRLTHFDHAVEENDWDVVMYGLQRGIDQEKIELTLKHALQAKAWRVVVLLVKLTMRESTVERDQFFLEAVKQHIWGAVRLLLERGVSLEACMAVLWYLVDARQWIPVARIMEYEVDDNLRWSVMWKALNKREGSVVAHIIRIMKGRLSVTERGDIFQEAFYHFVYQALKPLVEEKDDTGIAQRDKALKDAVRHHCWDLVDQCTRHGADVDMKASSGLTLLQEACEYTDREGVEGLLLHGANQFVLDDEGRSPLHRAVDLECFDIVKLLIQFQGDINQPTPDGRTPLSGLLNTVEPEVPEADSKFVNTEKVAELIDCALLWGRSVSEGKSRQFGWTALHILCEAGLWKSMRYVVARGGDPLRRSLPYGKSVLHLAARNGDRQSVAECVRMGLSTHLDITPYYAWRETRTNRSHEAESECLAIAEILYQSGSISNRAMQNARPSWRMDLYMARWPSPLWDNPTCYTYLKRTTASPRTLQSLCRLCISHSIGVSKPRTRERKVRKLPLPEPMKEYVLFSDLLDPQLGQRILETTDLEDIDESFSSSSDEFGMWGEVIESDEPSADESWENDSHKEWLVHT